jgi:BASS family bile acid:Na+ symporter
MELNPFIQFGLPVSLAFIMLSLGLTIRLDVFIQQMSAPRATLVGLFAQLFLVPVLALTVAYIFSMPPELAAGLMILSFCPGGVTSNWFSHMARANVPLSICLTVIASLITPFTIPLLSELSLQFLMHDQREVHIPLGLTMMRLFVITVIPVVAGIIIRTRFEGFSSRWQPLAYRFSSSLFLCVIAAIIIQQWPHLPGYLAQSGLPSTALILAGIGAGTLLARVSRLTRRDQHTVAIEVGMQNGGMALVVTQNVLQSGVLSVVPVIYGLIMLVPVYLYSRYARAQSV